MTFHVEDLDDVTKFRQVAAIPYHDIISFIMEYLTKKSVLIVSYWCLCIFLLLLAIRIRIYISGSFSIDKIFIHSLLGAVVFPLLAIPIHELLHILPYWLSGARRIKVGMDLKQYLFYVTAHRYVASPTQFKAVAFIPFLVISICLILLIIFLPGLWKWSLSLFLFVHTTMCAGDFALLNFYHINRDKKIYTWDDADQKMAYFYERI